MRDKVDISAAELDLILTNTGASLYELSRNKTIMLVFLRHFGCIFCREALRDLSQLRAEFVERNIEIVFVHMEGNIMAREYFAKYNLEGVKHVHDPNKSYYQRFGLHRGNFSQLFGLKFLVRGAEVMATTRDLGGIPKADSFQMPGIFVLKNGKLQSQFIHRSVADRPNYEELVSCCAHERI